MLNVTQQRNTTVNPRLARSVQDESLARLSRGRCTVLTIEVGQKSIVDVEEKYKRG